MRDNLARLALAALAVVVAGAVIAVGARLANLPPTPTPAPTFTGTLTFESAGTIDLPVDNYPIRLWPDRRLLVGEEHLFDLATGATERLADILGPGPSPSVYPIADGRVVLIDDKDIDGAIAQGQHAVAVLDPESGEVTEVGRLPAYAYEKVLVLRDGRIFGSGGQRVDDVGGGEVFDTAYVFDIDTGRTTQLGPLRQPRVQHTAVELLDGRVLLLGGEPAEDHLFPGPITWLEVYDLELGTSTPVEDGPLFKGWGNDWPFVQLADGQVVVGGLGLDMLEPCPFFPRPSGGMLGGGSGRQVIRLRTQVFDPATGTLRVGPLVPRPDYAYVPLDGDRVLISRQERAFASCEVDATRVDSAWLGIADFGSGTLVGSPKPLTGEGTLDVQPEAVYSSGVLLPDGRVALLEAPGNVLGPRRIDILTIDP